MEKNEKFEKCWVNIYDKIDALSKEVFKHSCGMKPEEMFRKGCVRILVCGSCQSGKSTFLNRMIADITKRNNSQYRIFCPTDTSSCTTCAWVVKYGIIPRARIFYKVKAKNEKFFEVCLQKKRKRKLEQIWKDLRENQSEDGYKIGYYKGQNIVRVEIEIDEVSLQNIEIIDTPGFGETSDFDTVARGLYEKSDLIFYFARTTVGQGFDLEDKDELDLICRRLKICFGMDGLQRLRIIAPKVDILLNDKIKNSDEEDSDSDEEERYEKKIEEKLNNMSQALEKEQLTQTKEEEEIVKVTFTKDVIFPCCSIRNKESQKYYDFYQSCSKSIVEFVMNFKEQELFNLPALRYVNLLHGYMQMLKCVHDTYGRRQKLREHFKLWKLEEENIKALVSEEFPIFDEHEQQTMKDELWRRFNEDVTEEELRSKHDRSDVEKEAFNIIFGMIEDVYSESFSKLEESVHLKFLRIFKNCFTPAKKEKHKKKDKKAEKKEDEELKRIKKELGEQSPGPIDFELNGEFIVSKQRVKVGASVVLPPIVGFSTIPGIGVVPGMVLLFGSGILWYDWPLWPRKRRLSNILEGIGKIGSDIYIKSIDDEHKKRRIFEKAWDEFQKQDPNSRLKKILEEGIARVMQFIVTRYDQIVAVDCRVVMSGEKFDVDEINTVSERIVEVEGEIEELKNSFEIEKWIVPNVLKVCGGRESEATKKQILEEEEEELKERVNFRRRRKKLEEEDEDEGEGED